MEYVEVLREQNGGKTLRRRLEEKSSMFTYIQVHLIFYVHVTPVGYARRSTVEHCCIATSDGDWDWIALKRLQFEDLVEKFVIWIGGFSGWSFTLDWELMLIDQPNLSITIFWIPPKYRLTISLQTLTKRVPTLYTNQLTSTQPPPLLHPVPRAVVSEKQ